MEKERQENKPLITTIIPTYRRPKLLKRAILSVLNQTYLNFQICIYDNASSDETAEIVKELSQKDSRIHYYCHSHNIGALNNFNFGLKQINTSYFSILSDDDILLPNFYKKAIEAFKKYPEAGFVATQTITVTDKEVKDISFKGYEEKLYQPPEGLLKISDPELATLTGILFRKEVMEDGLLSEEGDGYFILKISSVFSYSVLKFPGAIFYINELSLSSNWSEIEHLKEYKKALDKIKNNETIPDLFRETIYQNFKKGVIQALWMGGLRDFKRMRFSQAKQSAKSLKDDFNENLKSIILYYSVKLCEFSNIFYYVFLELIKIRKFINIKKKVKEKKLQDIYNPYLKYLDKYSA